MRQETGPNTTWCAQVRRTALRKPHAPAAAPRGQHVAAPSAAAGLSPAGLDGAPPTGDAAHRAQREALGNRPCGLTLDDPPEFLLYRHQRYAFRVVELPAVDTAKVPLRGIRDKAPSASGIGLCTRRQASGQRRDRHHSRSRSELAVLGDQPAARRPPTRAATVPRNA